MFPDSDDDGGHGAEVLQQPGQGGLVHHGGDPRPPPRHPLDQLDGGRRGHVAALRRHQDHILDEEALRQILDERLEHFIVSPVVLKKASN